jgi:hypothetical protein
MPSAISLWSSLANKVRESSIEDNGQDENTSTVRRRQESQGSDLAILRNYNGSLLSEASQLLSKEWGVSEDEYPASRDMREKCPMALVSVAVNFCDDCCFILS